MTYKWQENFNGKCDELKAEIIDQRIQQMVSSRESGEIIEIIQEPINMLIEKIKGLENELNFANKKIISLSTNKFNTGENITMEHSSTLDVSIRKNLLAMAKSHEVNLGTAYLAHIPSIPNDENGKQKKK